MSPYFPEEVFAALLDRGPIIGIRIRLVALRSWDRKVSYGSSRDHFKGRRCRRGTEATPLEHTSTERTYEQQREGCYDQCSSNFHIYSPRLLMTYLCCSVGFTLTWDW